MTKVKHDTAFCRPEGYAVAVDGLLDFNYTYGSFHGRAIPLYFSKDEAESHAQVLRQDYGKKAEVVCLSFTPKEAP